MSFAELIRVLLFVGGVAAVYVTAFAFALNWWRERRAPAPPASRRFLLFRRAVFFLAGAGLLCMAYGYFVEPYWLEVREVRITSPKLKGASRPVRILLLSDLHSDPKPRLEERLPEIAASLQPDLILFAGDSINSVDALPVFQRCLARLAQIAPTYVVKGNWDTWWGDRVRLFANTGVTELNGQVERVAIAGTEVWLTGAAFGNEAAIGPALDLIPSERLAVLVYHLPDEIERAVAHHADLYVAGHIHGGQVALPFYGALITLSRFGKKYEAGLYRVGETALYVNRGIGMEGGPAPRVRFSARPEATLLELAAP